MTHIPGRATPEGTRRYADRHRARVAPGHFRTFDGLQVSSIGIGTYLGQSNDTDDAAYAESLTAALRGGVNLIDTAINYRCQRSERVIGRVLRNLIDAGEVARDEIVVCTKGGFLPFDGDVPADPSSYFRRTYITPGVFTPSDVSAGCHCMTPKYLEDQIRRSRDNLQLETLDLYYLHNPEMQLEDTPRQDVLQLMTSAFSALEEQIARSAIGRFGTATWDAYRVSPDHPSALPLQDLLDRAQRVGDARRASATRSTPASGPYRDDGARHFAAIQLPYNLAMPEAYLHPGHTNAEGRPVSAIELANRAAMGVFCSASILQGQLSRGLPEWLRQRFHGLRTDAQCAAQFVRSTPGVTTALVGVRQRSHLEELLEVAATPPADAGVVADIFHHAG